MADHRRDQYPLGPSESDIMEAFDGARWIAWQNMPLAAAGVWMDCVRMVFLLGPRVSPTQIAHFRKAAIRLAEMLAKERGVIDGWSVAAKNILYAIYQLCAGELRDRLAEGIDESEFERLRNLMRELIVNPSDLDSFISKVHYVRVTKGNL